MSSVINETLLLIKSAFESGVNIFNGGGGGLIELFTGLIAEINVVVKG